MLDTPTKRRIDTCRDILVGKVPDPKSQVEQITIALIYKFMDDMDLEAEELGGERRFFTKEYERYRWAKLAAPGVSGQDMLNTYSEALTKMVENEGLPKLFRDIFRNAYLPYRDPETLRAFLREIDTFTYDHSERLGDAFEYLLSVLGSQGDAGQFRTPRHIIDFMVEIIDPKKTEVILDPACGTAGFLISAYKHILKRNSTGVTNGNGASTEGDAAEQALESPMRYPGDLLQPEDRTRLARNIKGYDISPDMVRLSLVNLYLHGFADPKVEEYDTLTSEDKWTEMADVILANPPFMSPKGGIKPHTRFQVQSKRSEVLFVDYIAEHLTPNGRAAIVVPEGIIFQSQSAYVALRKMLVENYLAAVISLPAGVFNPYSGVKTSILILDRAVAKASKHVAFFKIENDGFALGAQRKAVKGSQLAEVKAELGAWLQAARAGGGEGLESSLGSAVERARLAEGGDYNLSAERYGEVQQRQAAFPLVRLEDVVEILDSKRRPITKSDRVAGPYPYYGATGELDRVEDYIFDEPLVLLGEDGAKWGPGEKSAFAISGKTWVNNHAHVLRPDRKRLLDKFLIELLNEANLMPFVSGVTVPKLNQQNLRSIEIPLPPLEVQREIVAEVEGYQRVIDGARAVLDNYRPHIPVDPEWPLVELAAVCDSIQNGYPVEQFDGIGKYRVTRIQTIADGSVDLAKTKSTNDDVPSERLMRQGDILFSHINSFDHLAKTAYFDCDNCDVVHGINLVRLRPDPDKINSKYLSIALKSEAFVENARRFAQRAVNQASIKVSDIRALEVPLPPEAIQAAIVAEVEAEQALVNGNRDLIARFEKKIDAAIARVWGEAQSDAAA